MRYFIAWFLKWLVNWSKIIEGLIGILTLNLFNPSITLIMAKHLARYRYYNNVKYTRLS